MAFALVRSMAKRQDNNGGYYGGGLDGTSAYSPTDGDSFWSRENTGIRYAIIVALIVAVLLFFAGGRYHAQRRLRAGKPPLAYHAFMVRRTRRRWDQRGGSYFYNGFGGVGHGGPQQHPGGPGGEAYPMHDRDSYPLPPPPYQPPPVYQPPEGASKVLADQEYGRAPGAGTAPEAGSASGPSASAGPAAPAPAHQSASPPPAPQPASQPHS